MLILFHKNNKVVEILDYATSETVLLEEKNPAKALFALASKYKHCIISWSHISNRNNINIEALKACFTSSNVMVSYSKSTYLGNDIGYIEDSTFIHVNRKVKYPTWLMHGNCGAIYSENLQLFKKYINFKNSFDYNLNSIAKLGMANGLYCYYDPEIIKNKTKNYIETKGTTFELFQFVKEHFRARWIFLLFFNMLIFEKKILLIPLIKSLFFKQKVFNEVITSKIQAKEALINSSVSVLIPTLGRSKYLYTVLKDLAIQTRMPAEVIIIEQSNSKVFETELNYLKTEAWPFKIIHKLISQTGACNARNIGLALVSSEYVFMADDDIRIKETTIDMALKFMQTHNFKALTLSCLRENQIENRKTPIQWGAFGSGCSIVNTKIIKNLKFNMAFEHGFGEDSDFGMQLRNIGVDVIYFPNETLRHLKAPIGGFRNKYKHAWEYEKVMPKPSPTVMLYNLKYKTAQQLNSFKVTLFFKFYKKQSIKNPFKYYNVFKNRWKQSTIWANRLNNINN